MNTTNDQQLDVAILAKQDIGSSTTNWKDPELKPGEKKSIKFYQRQKSSLENLIKEREEELQILRIAYKEALDFEATETARRQHLEEDIQRLHSEIESLKEQVKQKQERKENLRKGIKQHIALHDELEEREEVTTQPAPKKEVAPKQKHHFFESFYRKILPVLLLVLFCIFDGVNMFVNLNNYSYDTVRHGFISAVIFVGVLFSSLGVKMRNTPVFWIAFIAFLSIANFPQFMSKERLFSLSNLTSSAEHIVVFALSFGGSILVTLLNLSLKEKRKEHSEYTSIIPVKAVETAAERTLKNLYAEFDAARQEISSIEHRIAGKEKELQDKKDAAIQETSARTNEKVEAVQAFAAKQKQISTVIDEIKLQIDELQDQCTDTIEKYRQEVSIHRLIHDYPEAVNYMDIKLITI